MMYNEINVLCFPLRRAGINNNNMMISDSTRTAKYPIKYPETAILNTLQILKPVCYYEDVGFVGLIDICVFVSVQN